MLVLTRRVAETVWIGEDIRITVYDLLRHHVLIGVLAPEEAEVALGGASLRTVDLEDGTGFSLLALTSREAFTVGEAKVCVAFKPAYLTAAPRLRQVRIGVDAPRSLAVYRQEIYLRKRAAAGLPAPATDLSAWIRCANLSVSARARA